MKVTEARPRRILYQFAPADGEYAEGGALRMRAWGLSKKGANYKPAPTPDVRCDQIGRAHV